MNLKKEPGSSASTDEVATRMALVSEIKAFQAKLDWAPTKNFSEYRSSQGSYLYCGTSGTFDFEVTGRWDISKEECSASSGDAYFVEVEAIAGVGMPLSPAMVRSPLARFIMVVFHEDFHEQIPDIPTIETNESAATLLGFLSARDFAREKEGEQSLLAQTFSSDIEYSRQAAFVEKQYYDALSNLYERLRRGKISKDEALREKARLYKEMQSTCATVRLSTVMSCGVMANNAAFERSFRYSVYYPLLYDLHQVCGEDTKKTGDIIIALAKKELTEKEFVRRVETLIKNRCIE